RKEVMPVSPAAFPGWLARILPRFDVHVWDESARLPLSEVCAHDLLDFSLTRFVSCCHLGEVGLTARFVQSLSRDPLDRIESLLVSILTPRHEIQALPSAQVIHHVAIGAAAVSPQSADRRSMRGAIERHD